MAEQITAEPTVVNKEREKKKSLKIEPLFRTVKDDFSQQEDLYEMEDDKDQGFIRDRDPWKDAVAAELMETNLSILAVRGCEPGDEHLLETLYRVPGPLGAIREAIGKDFFIVSTEPSLDMITDNSMQKAIRSARSTQSFDWDDTDRSELTTKLKELGFEKIPDAAMKFALTTALAMTFPQYLPIRILGGLLGRQEIPHFLSRRLVPVRPATKLGADKFQELIPSELLQRIHRISRFPFIQSKDLDFQHALMAIKLRDVHEKLQETEDVSGETIAILPLHEARAQVILNDEEKQKEVVTAGIRHMLEVYDEIGKASGERMTEEKRDYITELISEYLGDTEVRRVESMRPIEAINTLMKRVSVVDRSVSPTVRSKVRSVAADMWPFYAPNINDF